MTNQLFDTDRYLQQIEERLDMDQFKPPFNKVPATNLPKLAPDKKVVPIQVRVALKIWGLTK